MTPPKAPEPTKRTVAAERGQEVLVVDAEAEVVPARESNLPDLIAFHEQSGMAVFTKAGANFVRQMFCPDATDIELAYFAQLCNDLQLDPRRGEIHLVSRYDSKIKANRATPQVSLAGMLALAERSGEYLGHTPYEWCGPDGEWRQVWLEKEPPAAARVGVHRKGYPEPVWGIARWSSYAVTKKDGTVTQMWGKFPDRMLAKCALAQALRETFPRGLNGAYEETELQQAAPAEGGSE